MVTLQFFLGLILLILFLSLHTEQMTEIPNLSGGRRTRSLPTSRDKVRTSLCLQRQAAQGCARWRTTRCRAHLDGFVYGTTRKLPLALNSSDTFRFRTCRRHPGSDAYSLVHNGSPESDSESRPRGQFTKGSPFGSPRFRMLRRGHPREHGHTSSPSPTA